jgi:hypothetical protein
VDSLGLSENRKNPDSLLGGCAALMLKLVLRFYWIAGAKIQPAMGIVWLGRQDVAFWHPAFIT